ncbi:MAG TPA: GTP 3',8-cyclase MoaA [Gemmatimonadales bacterium]|nr:GTP 3',8-cyclase MoaA [Gemmatimonadales bacterium]
MTDRFDRPLGSLRLSVTDRCNLRCQYCMPESEYTWLPRESILTFEELTRLAGIFAGLGASRVRLTGGEPLLRKGLPDLIERLSAVEGVAEVALTTNGLLLAERAQALRAAGLGRVTVSLDTLDPARFHALTRSQRHADVLAGIEALHAAGFGGTKLNTVVMRGVNDDEVVALLEFGRLHGAEVRFIEYMDVGGATGWSSGRVVSREEILERISRTFGPPSPISPPGSRAPAEQFALANGTRFGIIASTTAPFCRTCDRSRVTADGTWFLCLYAEDGVDLRSPLRSGATDTDLMTLIRQRWSRRDDRGAELRAALPGRGALYAIEGLRADPRREMHTRGG